MEITKYIHDNYNNKSVNLIHCSWANPYNPWHNLPVKFYLEKDMVNVRINNLCDLNDSIFNDECENLLIIRKGDLKNKECRNKINSYNLTLKKQSIPKWIERLNKEADNNKILLLYSR